MRMTSALALVAVLCVAGHTVALDNDAADAQTAPTSFVRTVDCLEWPSIPITDTNPFNIVAAFDIPSVSQSGVGGSIQEVWIDISLFDNNFAPNTFIGAGPFHPGNETQRFEWQELMPARRHYYRLNALTPTGWREVGRGMFDTPDCRTLRLQRCSGDTNVDVMFAVQNVPSLAADNSGRSDPIVQWVDLSLLNNNFAPGTFLSAGPLPANILNTPLTFEWPGLMGDRVHLVRVNALYSGGWVPQSRIAFLTLDCTGLPSPPRPGAI